MNNAQYHQKRTNIMSFAPEQQLSGNKKSETLSLIDFISTPTYQLYYS